MVEDKINKEKHYPKFANFCEYLFWSYARSAMPLCCAKNLQMLCAVDGTESKSIFQRIIIITTL